MFKLLKVHFSQTGLFPDEVEHSRTDKVSEVAPILSTDDTNAVIGAVRSSSEPKKSCFDAICYQC